MSSLSGQADCASIKFCILFLSSRWFPLATSVLYLFIAFRADFMLIEISPFGVFLALVHKWQNQSWDGKLKFFRSVSFSRILSRTHFLWNGRLHSAQESESCFLFPSICDGVFCLHKKQCAVCDVLGSRWIRALGVLWLSGSVTRRMRPVLGCPCSCGG